MPGHKLGNQPGVAPCLFEFNLFYLERKWFSDTLKELMQLGDLRFSKLIMTMAAVLICLSAKNAFAEKAPCSDPGIRITLSWEKRGKIPSSRLPKVSELKQVPKDFVADREDVLLESMAYAALLKMIASAESQGIHLRIRSGFRSESTQQRIINSKFKNGFCPNDVFKVIAPVGYSTHATGQAIDFYPATKTFAVGKAYRWLKTNSGKYGFGETYFDGNPYGISWEPWHYDFTSH